MKPMYLSLLLLAVLLFSSCSSPKVAVLGFVNSMQDLDFAKAKKYSSQDTQLALDGLEKIMTMMPKDNSLSTEEKKPITKDWITCKTTGKEGKCTVCEDDDCTENLIKVIKEKGQWKVHLTKEEMNKQSLSE